MDKEEKKPTTISVGGVIGKLSDLNSIPKIMELADRELYKAKDMGRNVILLRNYINSPLTNPQGNSL